MSIYNINQAMGLIDDDLIEAAVYPSEPKAKTAKTAVFAPDFARRPWVKYAVAAAAFIVVVAGALVAINVTGAWRNDNLVPPNSGSENPGVIPSTGSDSGEPDGRSAPDSENPGSAPGSEGTPAISDNSSAQSGGNSDSENHGGRSSTPDKPDGTQTPPSEEPEVVIEGDFMKDNMPAVTYRIAGESRTFVYQKSSVVKTSESGDGKPTYSVVDRYADHDGATLSVNADTGELIQYVANRPSSLSPAGGISEADAVEEARHIALNTDIAVNGVENAVVANKISDEGYYSISDEGYCVALLADDGVVEVCLDNTGNLLYLSVIKAD
ncbi:MAG: hypothetical protein IJU94_04435 [Clostridia bacterium]|nr:hypothetical protein [Clostridia bacterium]